MLRRVRNRQCYYYYYYYSMSQHTLGKSFIQMCQLFVTQQKGTNGLRLKKEKRPRATLAIHQSDQTRQHSRGQWPLKGNKCPIIGTDL